MFDEDQLDFSGTLAQEARGVAEQITVSTDITPENLEALAKELAEGIDRPATREDDKIIKLVF